MLWVFLTIFATCIQVIRATFQKSLSLKFDALSVTWVRFVFGLPFVYIFVFSFCVINHNTARPKKKKKGRKNNIVFWVS